ncbi:sigma-70 family RNA polymerase sigma factor [Nitrosophilus alvini]|uniref:sigma-70 family RNA polymerase sigma factor n=1 Tax=Nitrosophilus alvini TaxID=2714855 RepID=UPI00190E306A|nr:sigma-70 family RNA polymerase sigma factor [Nitrosophilus alvini]
MDFDRDKKQEIILEHTPLVKKVASKIYFKLPKDAGIEYDDLVNTGIIGLIKAIDMYNKDKAKFSTYAYIKIRGEILDFLRSLHIVPRSMREKIKKEREENPDAKETPLSNLAIMLSMEKALGSDGSLKISDTLVSDDRSPEEEAIISEMREQIEEAMQELGDKERAALQMFFFEEREPKEISQILGISQSRVSQLKSQAIIKVKKILTRLERI